MDESKRQPAGLFQGTGTSVLPDHPALIGGECLSCGNVFFPMQWFGCERCGSVNLKERTLTGRGKVLTCAKVHEHRSPGREAPFTVAAVLMEDGPMVRALLDPATADVTNIGDMVVTSLVPETRPNRGELDIRLTRAVGRCAS